MKYIFSIFLAFLPLISEACGRYYEVEIENSTKQRELDIQQVKLLRSTADMILIGRAGTRGDSEISGFNSKIEIAVEKSLKGSASGVVYAHTDMLKDPNEHLLENGKIQRKSPETGLLEEIEVKCYKDPVAMSAFDINLAGGYRYLIYIKDGIVVRANEFIEIQALSPEEELGFIN